MSDVTRIGYVPEKKRWRATVTYEVDNAEMRQEIFDIWELEELQSLIEGGPTFCSIRDFKIEYMGSKETIKEAATQ